MTVSSPAGHLCIQLGSRLGSTKCRVSYDTKLCDTLIVFLKIIFLSGKKVYFVENKSVNQWKSLNYQHVSTN